MFNLAQATRLDKLPPSCSMMVWALWRSISMLLQKKWSLAHQRKPTLIDQFMRCWLIVFSTQLFRNLSIALFEYIQPGDEIIVSKLDHEVCLLCLNQREKPFCYFQNSRKRIWDLFTALGEHCFVGTISQRSERKTQVVRANRQKESSAWPGGYAKPPERPNKISCSDAYQQHLRNDQRH